MADLNMGNMSPEDYAQQQQLNRQQQMAQLLMQQGTQQQPAGQMVSGRYVPNSFFQNLVPLANIAASQYVGGKADTEAGKLAQKLKEGKENDRQAALQEIKNGNLLGALNLPNTYGGANPFQSALIEQVIPKPLKPQAVPPGGALVDANGKVIYQAPYRPLQGESGLGLSEGGFNKKGDYIAPGNVFIGKAEVAKDREIARSANDLRQGLSQLTPQDIKATETVLGDVTQNGIKKYIASQLGNPALAAQAKVNTSAVMQTLQNLPPGPASDKDIMQAKSSFPGYGNAQDLQDWVNNTNSLLERKINNVNQKYGSENWYGAQGISAKPQTIAKTVSRTGKVTSGTNAGKTAIEYSDGSIEYK